MIICDTGHHELTCISIMNTLFVHDDNVQVENINAKMYCRFNTKDKLVRNVQKHNFYLDVTRMALSENKLVVFIVINNQIKYAIDYVIVFFSTSGRIIFKIKKTQFI